jgi:hypothetical protein
MKDVDANRILYVKQNLVMGDGKFYRMRDDGDSSTQEVTRFYQRQTIM